MRDDRLPIMRIFTALFFIQTDYIATSFDPDLFDLERGWILCVAALWNTLKPACTAAKHRSVIEKDQVHFGKQIASTFEKLFLGSNPSGNAVHPKSLGPLVRSPGPRTPWLDRDDAVQALRFPESGSFLSNALRLGRYHWRRVDATRSDKLPVRRQSRSGELP